MCWKLIIAVSIIRACVSSKIPVPLRNNKQFMKCRRSCGFALLPALTDLTQQSEQPGRENSRNLQERGSHSESSVQALPKSFGMNSENDIHESTSIQVKIQNITMNGEIKGKAKNRNIQGVDLIKQIDYLNEQIRIHNLRQESPAEQVRGLPTNFTFVNETLTARYKELEIESNAFIEQETMLFLEERTKRTQCLAWNILNFMISDQAVDLAEWLDADGSRIRVLSEICGGRPESDVKSSLLEIFDNVPETRYTRMTALLNDLLAFDVDMKLMQYAVGIPGHAVGHAGMVLANAEAIQCRFPFPFQLRCGVSSHFSVRAVAGFRA
jgi:hypothetical protein